MQTYVCGVCKILFSELKYWNEKDKVPFCGPKCSLKYHEEKRNK